MPAKGHSRSKFRGEMCRQLINIFSKGGGRDTFCSTHEISGHTFDRWLDTYPTFLDAYVVAQQKAMQYFNNIALDHLVEDKDGPRMNVRVFELIMRNRFQLPQNRIVKLQGMSARTSQEKLDSICDAVAKGLLAADEAQKLASLIDSTIKVAEHDELRKRIEAIEQANKIGLDDAEFQEA